MKKQLFSILTATAMTLSAMPFTASAEETVLYTDSVIETNDFTPKEPFVRNKLSDELQKAYDNGDTSFEARIGYYDADTSDLYAIIKQKRAEYREKLSKEISDMTEVSEKTHAYSKQLEQELVYPPRAERVEEILDAIGVDHKDVVYPLWCSEFNCTLNREQLQKAVDNDLVNSIILKKELYVDSSAMTTTLPTTDTTTTTFVTTTYYFEITTKPEITLKGDANLDGEINMADAVLIMQSFANPNKYGINGTDKTHITAQGEKNGDMDGNGITNADALAIQKDLLKLN